VNDTADIPVIAIVGRSDSGKTTVVEGVVAKLTRRGFAVATAKHHPLASHADTPRTDSWRHARAGAVVAMLVTRETLGTAEPLDRELTLDELASRARGAGADLLIAEGFKRDAAVRIEVVDAAVDPEPVCSGSDLTALVTDASSPPAGYEHLPTYTRDDSNGLSGFIERRYLQDGSGGDHAD
jgi:molybdopterin-guanine dinucleotide biosynthesis protein B